MLRKPCHALGFVLLFLAPAPLAAQEKAIFRPALTAEFLDKAVEVDWFGVYLVGNKIGYGKYSFARVDEKDAGAGYRGGIEMEAKIKALGVETEIKSGESFDFDGKAPFGLRQARMRESDGRSTRTIDLVRTDKGYDVTIVAGGEKTSRQIGPVDYTLADFLAARGWIVSKPKVGDTMVSRSFSLEDLKTDVERRKLTAIKETKVEGAPVTYYEVDVHIPKDNVDGSERIDGTGRTIAMKFGGAFELRSEPEKQARDVNFKADLFVIGMVKIDKPLGDSSKISSMTIEVNAAGMVIPSGPRQSVSKGENGTFICKMGKAHGVPAKATAKELEDGLTESATYPIKHPQIVAMTKEAIGDAKTDKEKVEKLVKYVNKFIKPSYTAQPLTIFDVLKKKEGDCTEYALLFTVLARAAGLPARELSGLVYMGDGDKAFGLHAWNEVVLDGHWVPIDASCDECEVNATHVCFGSGLKGNLDGMSVLGKLQFKLVEVKKEK